MNTVNQNQQPSAGAADPLQQTALAEDAAFEAELGLAPETDEGSPSIAEDNLSDGAADPDPDPANSDDESNAGDGEDSNADDDTQQAADDDGEGSDDDGQPAEGAEDPEGFDAIPKELQPKVGAIIKKVREKERAKASEQLAEVKATAERAQELENVKSQLETELSSLKAAKSVPSPTQDNPLADVFTEQELSQREIRLWDFLDRLKTQPEEIMVDDGQGGKRYMNEQELRYRIARADRIIQYHIPRRREWLNRAAQEEARLKEVVPNLDKSPVAAEVNRILAENPGIKSMPGYRKAAVAQVIGEMAMKRYGAKVLEMVTAKPGTPAKPAAPASVKPKLPIPPAPKPRAPVAMGTAMKETVSDDEFGDLLAAQRGGIG